MGTRTPTASAHITQDETGRLWIGETPFKLLMIVLDHVAYTLSPEEIVEQHYRELTVEQVAAALAYYREHKAEIDAEIARGTQMAERLRAESLDSPVRQKLRAL